MTNEMISDIINKIILYGTSAFTLIKSVQFFVEGQTRKQELKSKETVEVAKAQVELAKHNVLSASEVLRISENYFQVVRDLEKTKASLCEIKTDSEEKTQDILKMIDKIEEMIKENNQNFTAYIIGKKLS